MTLLAPSRLWLLLAVGALAAAYVVLQLRRRHRAVRHPGVDVVRSVAPHSAAWRRHLTASALLLAVMSLVLGLARPAYSTDIPRKEAVVVLAIDVSGSMAATDVAPTRLQAAVAAATAFIGAAPDTFKIGLVTFDTAGHTKVAPTTDRSELEAALKALRPTVGTAAGEGLATAVDVVQAAAGGAAGSTSGTPEGAVVLLTDGASTVGRSLDEASAKAADAQVPVYTIAYGTSSGTVTIRGVTTAVPSDPAAMAAVAEATGGSTYTATSAAQLNQVYDRIGIRISSLPGRIELTIPLAALAAGLLALGFAGTIVWSPRLV